MRYAGGIGGGRAEGDTEYFILIVILYREELCAGGLVPVHGAVCAVLGHHFLIDDLEGWMRHHLLCNFFRSRSGFE